jgi:hypothetical protein
MHSKEALAFVLIRIFLAHEHNAEHAAQSAAMRVPKEHTIAVMCSLWPCIHWIVSQRSAIACKKSCVAGSAYCVFVNIKQRDVVGFGLTPLCSPTAREECHGRTIERSFTKVTIGVGIVKAGMAMFW